MRDRAVRVTTYCLVWQMYLKHFSGRVRGLSPKQWMRQAQTGSGTWFIFSYKITFLDHVVLIFF